MLTDSLVVQLPKNNVAAASIKNEQKKVLDTIAKYISNQDNHDLAIKFNNVKHSVMAISDLFNMANLSSAKIDSLKKSYILLNNSIGELSIKSLNDTKTQKIGM